MSPVTWSSVLLVVAGILWMLSEAGHFSQCPLIKGHYLDTVVLNNKYSATLMHWYVYTWDKSGHTPARAGPSLAELFGLKSCWDQIWAVQGSRVRRLHFNYSPVSIVEFSNFDIYRYFDEYIIFREGAPSDFKKLSQPKIGKLVLSTNICTCSINDQWRLHPFSKDTANIFLKCKSKSRHIQQEEYCQRSVCRSM